MRAGTVFLPLLLAVTAACSADAPAGSGDARVESSAAVAPAGGSRASPPLAGSDSPTGTLCAARESVLFSCAVAAGKHVSLCASQDAGTDRGYVYYAYGSPAKPELVFPAGKHPPTEFRRTHLMFAGATGGYAYSFENSGYRYIVYSVSGSERLEDQGVLVTRGNPREAISSLPCRSGSVVEDDNVELLDLTLGWPADTDLEQHGLPERN